MTEKTEADPVGKLVSFGRGIGLEYNGIEILTDVDFTIHESDRIGVVGINGSGKTSLLRILAGEESSFTGELSQENSIAYVPQLVAVEECTILEYLSASSDEWWAGLNKASEIFDLQLEEESYDLPVDSLSGGELAKLNISLALAKRPSILLLDEPTNHLDLQSRKELAKMINDYTGAVVVVSHDRYFLDKVTSITWELDGGGMEQFSGGFNFYQEEKERRLLLVSSKIAGAKKKKAALIAKNDLLQRRQAKNRIAARNAAGSMSKIESGYFRNKASGTSGREAGDIADESMRISGEVSTLKAQRRKLQGRRINASVSSVESGRRNLISVVNGVLYCDGTRLVSNINLQVVFGDRMVLGGRNGSGKSGLLKALLGHDGAFELEGEVSLAEARIAYVDQNYSMVDPKLTVFENIEKSCASMSYEDIRKVLGDFLFQDERDFQKSASLLSGGELARLCLAKATVEKVELLILDEPTNNLDESTLDEYVEALNRYGGALFIISHDVAFLSEIGIQKAYRIKDGKFEQMSSTPEDPDDYFAEMTDGN